jgi:hypothetical protein
MSDQNNDATPKPIAVNLKLKMEGDYAAPALTRTEPERLVFADCACSCGTKGGGGSGR